MSAASASGAASSEALRRLVATALATWEKLVDMVMTQPVLKWALISMAMVLLGSKIRASLPLAGGFMRFLGNLGLIVALLAGLLGMVDFSQTGLRLDSLPEGLRRWLPVGSAPDQQVEGSTTRVPLARDGHFWVRARVGHGKQAQTVRFLIDTGATLTTLSPEAARRAGIKPSPSDQPVEMRTANGTSRGRLVRLARVQVGNVMARNLQAVVAPGMGETNVLGMNFLTRLESWRVEGKVMVLVPHHPTPERGAEREAGEREAGER